MKSRIRTWTWRLSADMSVNCTLRAEVAPLTELVIESLTITTCVVSTRSFGWTMKAPYNPSSFTPEECPWNHLIPTSEAINEYVNDDLDSIPHCVTPTTPSYLKSGNHDQSWEDINRVIELKFYVPVIAVAHFESMPMNCRSYSPKQIIVHFNMHKGTLCHLNWRSRILTIYLDHSCFASTPEYTA